MWWQGLPVLDAPVSMIKQPATLNCLWAGPDGQCGGVGDTLANRAAEMPVFRSSTTCPVPTQWLIGAALVGLVVGYLAWGR